MPDARNQFKGQGWSRKREEGWQRVFGTEMQAHDHDWPVCLHAALKHESHSLIRYCAHCGVDVD
jgi:hypothetical protein